MLATLAASGTSLLEAAFFAPQAERAAMPYYIAAGEKLIEARAQMSASECWAWAKRNFNRSEKLCRLYVSLAQLTLSRKNGTMARRAPGARFLSMPWEESVGSGFSPNPLNRLTANPTVSFCFCLGSRRI